MKTIKTKYMIGLGVLLLLSSGCLDNTEDLVHEGKVENTVTPTVEPSPVVNANFGLQINTTIPGQKDKFISTDVLNFQVQNKIHPQSNDRLHHYRRLS